MRIDIYNFVQYNIKMCFSFTYSTEKLIISNISFHYLTRYILLPFSERMMKNLIINSCMCVCYLLVTKCQSQNVTDGHQAKRGTRTGGRGAPRCSSTTKNQMTRILIGGVESRERGKIKEKSLNRRQGQVAEGRGQCFLQYSWRFGNSLSMVSQKFHHLQVCTNNYSRFFRNPWPSTGSSRGLCTWRRPIKKKNQTMLE